MKPSAPNEGDSPLSHVLKEWKVTASLPPRFPDRVWQRIARTEPARASLLTEVWRKLQEFLARPGLAAAYMTVLLVAGLTMGWAQGMGKSARVDRVLSSQDPQQIDPYQTRGN